MTFYDDGDVRLLQGDVSDPATTSEIADGSVQTIVTSPPYFGLRDYGHDQQLGTEPTIAEYVDRLVGIFATLRPKLSDTGTLWLNLGDSYSGNTVLGRSDAGRDLGGGGNRAGSGNPGVQGRRYRSSDDPGPKNLLGIPWRVALALQDDGWVLRSDIIWAKTNPMPESVTDRPTKSHEHLFLLAKSPVYYYDAEAIAEVATKGDAGSRFDVGKTVIHQPKNSHPIGGSRRAIEESEKFRTAAGNPYVNDGSRNKRDVWSVATVPFPGSHFAVYPPALIRPCIRAGSAVGDVVLDPFSGSGTTGMVALEEGRRYIGVDLSTDYLQLSLDTRFSRMPLDIWGSNA